MSFQHFRLGDFNQQHPQPPLHLVHHQPPSPSTLVPIHGPAQFIPAPNFHSNDLENHASKVRGKQPYGSGDSDDGYTLVFQNIEAFDVWRRNEEETNIVEFVKGDTHGSKAVPPRFKDHTKLLCARHSRSGRKKYVKKHPERVRKVPSRKIEGQGCSASISYKTYFDSDEVRVCYNSQHSHEIGPANLPFTRRGRKAAVQQEKERAARRSKTATTSAAPASDGGQYEHSDDDDDGVASPDPSHVDPQPEIQQHQPQSPSQVAQPPHHHSPHQQQPPPQVPFSAAVSMIAPLPAYGQMNGFGYPQTNYPPMAVDSNARWDNMATLFQNVREHARSYEYPAASVAALETVLIRLYLESPMGSQMAMMMPPQLNGGDQGGTRGT